MSARVGLRSGRWRAAALAVVACLTPLHAALAHPGEVVGPNDVWSHWSFEPGVVLGVLLGSLWYAAGVRALWRRGGRGRGVRRWQVWCYAAGMATLAIALLSPLDAAAEAIFAAHMLQHLLLIVVAAPLIALGAPGPALWWGVPRRVRPRLARIWLASGWARRVWRFVTAPGPVLVAHVFALWFWHFPGPYQLALGNDAVHAVEHLSFLATAVLYWWVVLQPTGHRRLSYPATLVYLVATLIQSGALGAFLVYASAPWYPAHAAGARAWGMTGLEDQQLAGIIMWIPAGVAYVAAAVWVFLAWMAWDEREAVRADAARRSSVGRVGRTNGSYLRALVLLVVAASASTFSGCTKVSAASPDQYVEGGDATRGAAAIRKYGCGSCHMIPGVDQANGMVGPPLIHWSQRRMVAGEVPNVPRQLITFIEMPQAIEPGTAMPNMSVSEGEARDIAAYLYSIR